MTYRNRALLDLARDKMCMNCLGSVCQAETVVAAHSNLQEHGRGSHHKANDCFIAWLGDRCHAWLDHGAKKDPTGVYECTREDKTLMFRKAMERTWLYMWTRDLIKVAA